MPMVRRSEGLTTRLCNCATVGHTTLRIAGSRSIYSASTTLAVLLTSMDVNDRP